MFCLASILPVDTLVISKMAEQFQSTAMGTYRFFVVNRFDEVLSLREIECAGAADATAPAGAPAAASAVTLSNKIRSSSPMAASRVRAATRHYHRRRLCPVPDGRRV